MSDTPVPVDGQFVLPVLPIKNTRLFPILCAHLSVGRANSRAAVEAALATEDKTLVIVAQRDTNDDNPALERLYNVGTRAVIKRMAQVPDGIEILVQGIDR